MATGLWPVLADLGFYDKTLLKQFGKVGSPLNDHPNMKLAPGIDFSSGSLGHNLSVGTGWRWPDGCPAGTTGRSC